MLLDSIQLSMSRLARARLPLLAFAALATIAPHAAADSVSGALQVGGFGAVAPKYEGAKDYEVVGFPFIAPGNGSGSNRIQFKGPDDVRLRLLEVGGLKLGPLAGWRFSRDEEDAARLNGLGDVDGGVVVGGFAAIDLGPIEPSISYHHAVTGDDTGGLLRLGADAKLGAIAGVSFKGTAGVTYADDEYMDTYFSINGAQARSSRARLATYDADSGVKDVHVGLAADVPLADAWTLKLTGKYTHLVGEAADSPIVESESQWFGGLGVTYRFPSPF